MTEVNLPHDYAILVAIPLRKATWRAVNGRTDELRRLGVFFSCWSRTLESDRNRKLPDGQEHGDRFGPGSDGTTD